VDPLVTKPKLFFEQKIFLFSFLQGLGKTVEVISLIYANPFRESEPAEETSTPQDQTSPHPHAPLSKTPEGRDVSRRKDLSKATLVVCPMSLLGQWVGELTSSMKPGTLKVLSY